MTGFLGGFLNWSGEVPTQFQFFFVTLTLPAFCGELFVFHGSRRTMDSLASYLSIYTITKKDIDWHLKSIMVEFD